MYFIDTSLITNIELDNVDIIDYPDFCDAYIISAEWKNTGKQLTDLELDKLNNNHDFVYDCVISYLF